MSRSGAVCLLLLAAAGVYARPPDPRSLPDEGGPDLLFYAERVSPEVQERCAGCHAEPETAGGYLLRPQVRDREALLANYRAAVRMVDERRPAESRLLLKALGQLNHGGGAVYPSVARKDYETLLDFALGGTLRNRPPDAIVTRRLDVAAGEAVDLDGTLSGDRDRDPLGFLWTLVARPDGSRAEIQGPDREVARLLPDLPGLYRIELAVHDGRLWSQPAAVSLMAAAGTGRAAPTQPGAGAEAGAPSLAELRLEAPRLRMIRRLYMDLLWRGSSPSRRPGPPGTRRSSTTSSSSTSSAPRRGRSPPSPRASPGGRSRRSAPSRRSSGASTSAHATRATTPSSPSSSSSASASPCRSRATGPSSSPARRCTTATG